MMKTVLDSIRSRQIGALVMACENQQYVDGYYSYHLAAVIRDDRRTRWDNATRFTSSSSIV